MTVLAFETSCDETSAAVVSDGQVRSNVVASQIQLHAEYGGVVPELATREHLRHWLPVGREALRSAGVRVEELSAIAALWLAVGWFARRWLARRRADSGGGER